MKNSVLIKISSFALTIALVLSSISSYQIIRAYAVEADETISSIEDNSSIDEDIDVEPYEEKDITNDDELENSDPDMNSIITPEQAEEPIPHETDPFDYNLICYTPNIDFGKIYQGDVAKQKQFTITNTGVNAFPLTWDTYDPNTAFIVEGPLNYNLEPGDCANFQVYPGRSLAPGTYKASLIFYSANDIRQHHTTQVNFTVVVENATPYISNITITPGNISVPIGKSYQFSANVTGGNNYNSAVTWSLIGNKSTGTTIADGRLNISSDESASTITVIATSNQDPSKSDAATVSLTSVDHVISISVDPVGSGATAGAGAVHNGCNTGITASPNNNYRFIGWYENGNIISTDKQYTLINVTNDHNLIAKFERMTCYVKTNVNNTDGGTVTGSSSVNYNGNYTITAKAKTGYYFEAFVENNHILSTSSSLQLNNIISDRNITAIFKKNKYTVNVSVNPSDTGKYEGAGNYEKDSTVRLRASAYDGYVFTGWTINGQIVSKDTTYEINRINNDINIVANFMKKEAKTYKLTSGIANEGGAIVPSGDYTAPEGSSVTYNIVPQANYKITAVTVDGKNIGAVSSYTFNNIKGTHTIKAAFKPIPIPQKTITNNGSTNKTANQKKTKTTPAPVEYNNDTATKGAIPEQNIVESAIPEEVENLEGEEYAEDTYSVAETQEPVNTEVENIGVISKYNLDEEMIKQLIHDKAANPILREAFNEGYLQITVNNSYATDTQETAVALYYKDPTLLNFEDIIAETLSEEEQLSVIKGSPIAFNVDITDNTNTLDDNTKSQMQKAIGYKPICYFDFQIMKTADGTSSIISTTNSELEVKIPIPETYQKEGRKYYIIREHEGNVEILEDIGNDPASITFKTDKFSEYAIAYETVNINHLILQLALIALISLFIALICFIALIHYKRKQRRLRRIAASK